MDFPNMPTIRASISRQFASKRPMGTWAFTIGAAILLLLVLQKWAKTRKLKLPPGPFNWPIVGGIFYLEPRVHRSFANLSKKYGPIFHIRFGLHHVVVISSPSLAEELYKQKDLEFSSRPNSTIQRTAARYIGFGAQDMGLASFTPNLKLIRKITAEELVTGVKLNASEKVRANETAIMVRNIVDASKKGETLDIQVVCYTLTTNILCQMFFGKRLYGTGQELTGEWKNFRQLVIDQTNIAGKFNLADLHPLFRFMPWNSVVAEFEDWYRRALAILGGIIKDHRAARKLRGSKVDTDFVDTLLTFQEEEPGKLTDNNIMGILSDVFVGGNDTSASSIEWVLLELIRAPKCMAKLQKEIDSVVGRERLVDISDVTNLPYLQAVVKENFRLHNPIPLLLPRNNEAAQVLGGYDIPANSSVFLNTYACSRDPSVWRNPEIFDPERFVGSEVGLHGTHYHYTPFGSGRRKCVGIGLGMAMVHRTVATIVQAFDLTLPPGTELSDEESEGIVSRPKHHLLVRATPRLAASLYESL